MKGIQEAPLLGRTHACAAPGGDVGSGTCDQLPGVGFTRLKNLRDLLIRVIECFPENIRRPFGRREFLQQQDSEFQGFAAFCSQSGVGASCPRVPGATSLRMFRAASARTERG